MPDRLWRPAIDRVSGEEIDISMCACGHPRCDHYRDRDACLAEAPDGGTWCGCMEFQHGR